MTLYGRNKEGLLPFIEKKAGVTFERVGAPQPADMARVAGGSERRALVADTACCRPCLWSCRSQQWQCDLGTGRVAVGCQRSGPRRPPTALSWLMASSCKAWRRRKVVQPKRV